MRILSMLAYAPASPDFSPAGFPDRRGSAKHEPSGGDSPDEPQAPYCDRILFSADPRYLNVLFDEQYRGGPHGVLCSNLFGESRSPGSHRQRAGGDFAGRTVGSSPV